MLKKLLSNILITAIVILGVGGAVAIPKTAHAACNIGGVVTGNGLTDCANEFAVTVIMPLTGKFLQLSAYLFDQALTLNMNIAQFLQKPTCQGKDCLVSPVEVIWKLIRDLSGMFFIFVLIWASIKMILGGDNSKNVIVGVVIAGLLVNFSLFATKVIIDASNAFTLTIYNAISPGQANVGLIDSAVGGMFNPSQNNNLYGKDGTVSSKIMQVVDLQSLFATTQNATKKTNFNVTAIVTVIGGASLMLVLGLAFLAAGLMFLWRFVMLLALMAFSPIPALAYAFPALNKYSSQFMENLLNQALFAPIFLFFIYIALRILTNEAFISIIGTKNNSFANVFGATGSVVTPLIQYGLVIFVIFMGLVTAKSFGAKGAAWGMGNITSLGKWTGGVIGRNTAGRLAKTASNTLDWASTKQIGDPNGTFAKTGNMLAKFPGVSAATKEGTRALRSGLKSISSSKFGSSQSLDDIKKEDKEHTKKQRELELVRSLKAAIAAKDSKRIEDALDKMTSGEVAALDKDILTNESVVPLLSKGVYSSVDKGDKSDAHKQAIMGAQEKIFSKVVENASSANPDSMKALKKAIDSFDKEDYPRIAEKAISDELSRTSRPPDEAVVKRLMKKVGGEDIAELSTSILTNPGFAKHLTSDQLKKMEFIDAATRKAIGSIILSDPSNVGHPYVSKNIATWS